MASPDAELALAVAQRAPIAIDAELACRGGELLALVGPRAAANPRCCA